MKNAGIGVFGFMVFTQNRRFLTEISEWFEWLQNQGRRGVGSSHYVFMQSYPGFLHCVERDRWGRWLLPEL